MRSLLDFAFPAPAVDMNRPKAARPQGKRCPVANGDYNNKYRQALAQRRTELPKKNKHPEHQRIWG
jgi:hypothetical protein